MGDVSLLLPHTTYHISKGTIPTTHSYAFTIRRIYIMSPQEQNIISLDFSYCINRLTPNDPYMGRTVPLISKRFILYIYSTNIGTEYFKHVLYSPFFLFKMQFLS